MSFSMLVTSLVKPSKTKTELHLLLSFVLKEQVVNIEHMEKWEVHDACMDAYIPW